MSIKQPCSASIIIPPSFALTLDMPFFAPQVVFPMQTLIQDYVDNMVHDYFCELRGIRAAASTPIPLII